MVKPIIRIHDLEKDEVIDREMTNSEFAEYKIAQEVIEQRKLEIQAKIEAKETAQAKLAALGLTVEDLTALGL
jgi:DNA-directed RNA polymerase subunit L